MLFNDTWSQYGHLVSCISIFLLCLQIIRSDLRSHIKWDISLVIVNGHLIFLRGLCGYVLVHILTLSPQQRPINPLIGACTYSNNKKATNSLTAVLFVLWGFSIHQIRHHATCKMGSHPSDFRGLC